MKKIWEKPVVIKMSIPKITLSGSAGNKENSGQDDQTIRRPA